MLDLFCVAYVVHNFCSFLRRAIILVFTVLLTPPVSSGSVLSMCLYRIRVYFHVQMWYRSVNGSNTNEIVLLLYIHTSKIG